MISKILVYVFGILASSAVIARADVVLLISNEKGSSISSFNITTSVTSTYFSGLTSPDGLAFGVDGFLYATTFGTSTSNGSLNRITSASTFTNIASGFNGSGALARDASGNFYVPNFGYPTGGGTTLSKVSPNGVGGYNNATLASGLSTPDGIAFDSHGVLYEADFNSNRINKIDPTSGVVTNFVANTAGLSRPSALVFDSQDNLYVANFGSATGVGGSVSKVTTAGAVTNNYVTNLNSPLGMVLDETDATFYVSSWNNNTLSSFPMAGGTANQIASGFNGPTHMVINVPEPAGSLWGAVVVALALLRRRRTSVARS